MPRSEPREPGLWLNGKLWWLRVRMPGAAPIPRSTGTADLRLANRIARMVAEMREIRDHWHWLDLAAAGELPLSILYQHHSAGTLHLLRASLEASATSDDPDIEPWVDRWDRESLTAKWKGGIISGERQELCVAYVRAIIPAGEPFPVSLWNEDEIKRRMGGLRHRNRGTELAPATLRKVVDALQLFHRYARKRVPLTVNPFEDADWIPSNSSPRSVYWDHDTVVKVLDWMTGDRRAFMALIFGTGMELGAALALQRKHLHSGGTIVAPGSKNEHREERTIFIADWARKILEGHIEGRNLLPSASLWQTINPKNRGRDVRDSFYWAQFSVGLLQKPQQADGSRKYLWKAVKPHTIHDARHSYCVIRMLGLDGEPRQDAKFCSMQLGHADETMVMKIYSKANLKERLRLIEMAEARRKRA